MTNESKNGTFTGVPVPKPFRDGHECKRQGGVLRRMFLREGRPAQPLRANARATDAPVPGPAPAMIAIAFLLDIFNAELRVLVRRWLTS